MEYISDDINRIIIDQLLDMLSKTILYFTAKSFRPFIDKILSKQEFVETAAYIGKRSLLKFAVEKGCQLTVTVLNRACLGTKKRAITWLILNNCPLNSCPCKFASSSNDLKYLKWCYLKNCKLDDTVLDEALLNKNYEIVYWLLENECPLGKYTLSAAISTDDKELVDLVIDKGCARHNDSIITAQSVEMLKYIRIKPTIPVASNFAKQGKLELLIWCLNNNMGYCNNIADCAAEKNQLHILRWLNSEGFTFNNSICDLASDIPTLEYLYSLGHRATKQCYMQAILYSKRKVIRWLITHGVEYDDEIVEYAKQKHIIM